MMKETPVLLLTGYLGSGKTTLVNKILSNRRGIRFAVIVNDIGEVNIDADLIQQGGVVGKKDESLVALQNGCICCTLKMDLIQQLADIMKMQRFDYIVIEASGICEPEPIARTICSIPSMGYEYVVNGLPRLDCIVTVVDALRLRSEFGCGDNLRRKDIGEDDLENLVVQQVEFCNKILINKVSEVTPEELGRIRAVIRALQPKAEIIECDYAEIDLDQIINTNSFDYESVATSATWVNKVEGPAPDDEDIEDGEHHHHRDDEEDDAGDHHQHHEEDEEDDHHHHHHHDEEDEDSTHHHHHHHHHHDDEGEAEEYGISTWVYYAREPFDINKFDFFVARQWPKQIIRAKGMCWFADETDICYLFEQAGSQFTMKNIGAWLATMPEEELQKQLQFDQQLQRDWDEHYGDRMQKIVFIGQHLDVAALREALDSCKASTSQYRL